MKNYRWYFDSKNEKNLLEYAQNNDNECLLSQNYPSILNYIWRTKNRLLSTHFKYFHRKKKLILIRNETSPFKCQHRQLPKNHTYHHVSQEDPQIYLSRFYLEFPADVQFLCLPPQTTSDVFTENRLNSRIIVDGCLRWEQMPDCECQFKYLIRFVRFCVCRTSVYYYFVRQHGKWSEVMGMMLFCRGLMGMSFGSDEILSMKKCE